MDGEDKVTKKNSIFQKQKNEYGIFVDLCVLLFKQSRFVEFQNNYQFRLFYTQKITNG